MRNVLEAKVSCFMSSNNTIPIKEVELIKILKSDRHQATIEKIRQIEDKAERDLLKSKLPAFTPSCTCSYRSQDRVIAHTGLIQFDIDQKDNPTWSMTDLRGILACDPCIAYCGLSISGRGLWGLIYVAHPEYHKEHFRFFSNWFKANKVIIDMAPSNVISLRFVSYDPDAYFKCNPEPLAYYEFEVPKDKKQSTRNRGALDQYNQSRAFEEVLLAYGWEIDHEKGAKVYYTRPGKTRGASAEYDSDRGLFYVFTSSTEFEPGKAYTPFAVYAILEHRRDYRKAASTLRRGLSLNI